MKNKFNSFYIYLFLYLMFSFTLSANEQFVFDITELEITEDGDRIKGLKRGKVTTNEGFTIDADEFDYDKVLNILKAKGNVVINDTIEEIIIYSNEATYFKNQEKVFTNGKSRAINEGITIDAHSFKYDKNLNTINATKNVEVNDTIQNYKIYSQDITYFKNEDKFYSSGSTSALIENKYDFTSSDVLFLRNKSELSSSSKTIIKDNKFSIYKLDEFSYSINDRLLKGKNIEVTTNDKRPKTDKYFFSEGFFNFANRSFVSSDTKIKLHKEIFLDPEMDPRLSGVSSHGNDEKTVINKGVFTSCKVSDSCPAWHIKAKKIIHDKKRREMIYKDAILKVYNIPVLYFPVFFHPDPTVDRRTGFLQPQLNNSDTLGSSLYLPYYKVLSKNKDYTFKPTVFEKPDKYILQNEYRQENKNSSFITDFSLIRGYRANRAEDNKENSITHFFLKYIYDFKLKDSLGKDYATSKLEAKIEKTNNDTYLRVFNSVLAESPVIPKGASQLVSSVDLSLATDNYSFMTGMTAYENLSGKSSDRYQYILPYYNYSKNFIPEYFNGSINYFSSGSNDLNNTNNLKTKIINDIEYNSLDNISILGFKSNFGIYFKNLNSMGKNDTIYKNSPQIEVFNILNFQTSFPLSKINSTSIEKIIPKLSLRINPANNMKENSGGGTINADNVFSINRLGINDSYEGGKSLTLGLDYRIEKKGKEFQDIDDKFLEFKIATVARNESEKFISAASTINRKTSNIFGSINNNLFEHIKVNYNFSLDNDLRSLDSNHITTTLSINNFVTTYDFRESTGILGETNTLSNVTTYTLNDNTSLEFRTRRNREINFTEYYDLIYQYETDCLRAAFTYNKKFYQDREIRPSEDLFFTITLIPLTTYERQLIKREPKRR